MFHTNGDEDRHLRGQVKGLVTETVIQLAFDQKEQLTTIRMIVARIFLTRLDLNISKGEVAARSSFACAEPLNATPREPTRYRRIHSVGIFDSFSTIMMGALKTQVQHFVGENVAWEKVTTN